MVVGSKNAAQTANRETIKSWHLSTEASKVMLGALDVAGGLRATTVSTVPYAIISPTTNVLVLPIKMSS